MGLKGKEIHTSVDYGNLLKSPLLHHLIMRRRKPHSAINRWTPTILRRLILEFINGQSTHAIDDICGVQAAGRVNVVGELRIPVCGLWIAAPARAFCHGSHEQIWETGAIVCCEDYVD